MSTLIPYLVVEDAGSAIDFYERAFGATLRFRMDTPGGTVAHASMEIGGQQLMLSDPFDQGPYRSPVDLGGTASGLYLYVDDVDAAFTRAVDAGAEARSPVQDMFWGDRWGSVMDPFGHVWELATHVEDVPEEELAERMKAAMPGLG